MEKIKRFLKSEFTPRKYVEEDIPFVRELDLPRETIRWISEVRKISEEEVVKINRVKRNRTNLDYRGPTMTTYDLVRLQLQLLHDLKQHPGYHLWSAQTEKMVENIFFYIVSREKERRPLNALSLEKRIESAKDYAADTFSQGDYNYVEYLKAVKQLTEARSIDEKLSAISLYLNTWHNENIGLGRNFIGIPTHKYIRPGENEVDFEYRSDRDLNFFDTQASYRKFLDNLNNIDNKLFWRKR